MEFKFARIDSKVVAEFLTIEAEDEDAAKEKISTMFHSSLLWVLIPDSLISEVAVGTLYDAKNSEFK